MNKYIYKSVLFVMVCMLGVSCQEDFMDTNKGNDVLTLTATLPNNVLSEKLHNSDGLSLEWTTGSNMGTENKINYSLELSEANNKDVSPVIYDLGTEVYQWSKSVKDLNTFIIDELKVEEGAKAVINAKITATVVGHSEYIQTSETQFTVTTYKPVSATLYMVGDATPSGWNLDNPTEMLLEDDGYFTWVGKLKANGGFKFITTKGNSAPAYNRDGSDETGISLLYSETSGDTDLTFNVKEDGNYEVIVDLINMTCKVKESTADPERFENVYIVGSFTDWYFKPLTKDVLQLNFWHYGAVFNWNNGGEFKFGTVDDGSWSNMLFASSSDAPYTSTDVVYNNSNDYKWQLTESECGKAYKIWLQVTKGKEKMIMKPFTAYPCLYLVGEATPNGWDLGNATAMKKVNDYEFSWTGKLNSGEIKVTCDKQSDWNGAWFMSSKSGKTPDGVEETAVFVDKSDPKFAEMYPDINVKDIDMKWQIPSAGTYKITMNQLTEKIIIEKQ